MITAEVETDRAVVHFSGRHAMMAFARQVSVPLATIRTVTVAPDGLALDLGWRVGGTGIPGRLAFGRYRRRGGIRTFAAVYSGEPALVIETSGGDWDRLAVTVEDPAEAAALVREAAGLG